MIRAMIFLILFLSLRANAGNNMNIISAYGDSRYLIGDYLVVSAFECPEDGVYVNFYDRKLYAKLAGVKIIDCDRDYEDNVYGIYSDGVDFFAEIKNKYSDSDRYRNTKRLSVVVIDGASLKIKNKMNYDQAVKSGYKFLGDKYKSSEDYLGLTEVVIKKWNSNEYRVDGVFNGNKFGSSYIFNEGIIEKVKILNDHEAVFLVRASGGVDYVCYYLVDLLNNNSRFLFSVPVYARDGSGGIYKIFSMSNSIVVRGNFIFGYNSSLFWVNLSDFIVRKLPQHESGIFGFENIDVYGGNRIDHIVDDKVNERVLVFCQEGNCNSYIPYSYLDEMKDFFE